MFMLQLKIVCILIIIRYNEDAFGDSIVANNGITIQRGDICFSVADYLTPAPSDFGWNSLEILIAAVPNPVNRTDLWQTPKELIKVRMEIQDCSKLPDLEFFQHSAILSGCWYSHDQSTSSGQTSVIYNWSGLGAGDTENQIMCGTKITNIHPLRLNAGVGDTFTVYGTNLGDVKGKLSFPATDNIPYLPQATLDTSDIILWTDSMIIAILPSTMPEITTLNPLVTPGSGRIRIQAQNALNPIGGHAISSQEVIIDYAVANVNTTDPFQGLIRPKTQKYLQGADSVYSSIDGSNGMGILFHYDQDIAQDTTILNCVRQAVEEWVCATGVRFELGTVTSLPPKLNLISTIHFDSVAFNSNTRAETRLWGEYCGSFPNERFTVHEIDIMIDSKTISTGGYLYDRFRTQNLGALQYDFYEIILHELGHAVLLDHVLNRYDIMYTYNRASGIPTYLNNRKVYFTTANYNGGSLAVQNSSQVDYSSYAPGTLPMTPVSNTLCQSLPWVTSNNDIENLDSDITVYPNPFTNQFNLNMNSLHTQDFQLNLYSVTGVLIKSSAYHLEKGANMILVDVPFEYKGVIIAKMILDEKVSKFVLIKE
jgi:hypothetical protein